MTTNNELGNYIKKFRGKHSIREAASIANISHSYWSDLERGYSRASGKPINPSVDTITKVADTLYEFNKDNFSRNDFLVDLLEFIGIPGDVNNQELYDNDEYTLIYSDNTDTTLKAERFNYPINDIKYHLMDDHFNTKFFNGIPLNHKELLNLKSLIETYLRSYTRIPLNAYEKITSLAGRKSVKEIERIYNVLRVAYLNKNHITSFDSFIQNALIEETGIDNIDSKKAYEIAESLFEE
nr:helix-turn-helix transcriptional regulator [Priestia megaterium]